MRREFDQVRLTGSARLHYELDVDMVGRATHISLLTTALLLGGGSFNHTVAAPIPACDAGDIIAGDSACPASGPCTISKVFEIADGCVLDFGTRSVTIAGSGELRIDAAAVTMKTGNFTISPGGLVDGRTAGTGGFFRVQANGSIAIQKATAIGKILVSGSGRGGNIVLEATGNITVAGQLIANNASAGSASGGNIALSAGGNIVTTSTSDIDAHGGDLGCGGSVDFGAGGSIDIGSLIDGTGGDGGVIDLEARGPAIIRNSLQTTGQGDAGSGGCIDVVGDSVDIIGTVQSKGTGSAIDSGGGCGGAIFVGANFGNAVVRNAIDVTSGAPDGGGGCIELFVSGDIDITSTGQIIAEGNGGQSCGGEAILEAEGDINVDGRVTATGGDSGGCVEIGAGGDIAIDAPVDAFGRTEGSFGGSIVMEAGVGATGNLTLTSLADASGAACDAFGFCSLAGDVDIAACDLTIGALGGIDAEATGSGGRGGSVFLAARDQLTVQGAIDATGGTTLFNGTVSLIHPPAVPPVLTGSIMPAGVDTPRAPCTGGPGDAQFCLTPCPLCGNGVTEFPETCDNANGTPLSCDGCSTICRVENCNDQNACTTDSCDPMLGCRHLRVADGSSCTDHTVCNGAETCMGGLCRAGMPLNCSDTNPCTLNSCHPVTGCQSSLAGAGTPCEDGNLCTTNETCTAGGVCTGGSPVVCNDNESCTVDSCIPATGCRFDPVPLAGQPCQSDGNSCTNDICFGVCVHPQRDNGSACDDGNACTQTDTCQGGACVGTNPVTCTALDQCHNAGVCNPGTGCTNPPKLNGTPCDDGNACTQTDTCQGGVCMGANPVVCTALDQCHAAGACNPSTGVCTNPPVPNGTLCEDGAFCTLDTCQAGACTSAPWDCDDGNACTASTCDETANLCRQDVITPCCGNGVVESGEQCDEGAGNSDAPNSTCRTNCTVPACGNGVVDDLLGEECDEGSANSDAPNASCRLDCRSRRCGDSVTDDLSDEQCDDGNGQAGDGCGAACFVEPPATAVLLRGKGSKRTDCVIEWKIDTPTLDSLGRPAPVQRCTDGDPSCDADGAANGQCLFEIWVCSNNSDPTLTLCAAGNAPGGTGVVAVTAVAVPTLPQALSNAVDADNREQMTKAVAAAPVGDTLDACGPRLRIRVPLKSPLKAGTKRLKLSATTTRGIKDVDVLPLTCKP